MTKDELIIQLASSLARKITLTDAQVINVISTMGPAVKAKFLTLVEEKDERKLGEFILGLMDRKRRNLAETSVTAMLVDDAITTDELISLLT